MPQPLLKNPFYIDWQKTKNENSELILKTLSETLDNVRPVKQKPVRCKTKADSKINNDSITENQESSCSKSENKSINVEENLTKKYFAFGTAQILRLLERRELTVAIFDRNLLTQPPVAYHIGMLCVNSGAFCGCLENMSSTLNLPLNLPRVSAIGIRSLNGSVDNDDENEKLKLILSTIRTLLTPVTLKDSVENKDVNRENENKIKANVAKYVAPSVTQPINFVKKRPKKEKIRKNKKSKN